MPTKNYEIPRYAAAPGDELLGWCLEAVQEGNAWLKTQAPARDWDGIKAALLPSTHEGLYAGDSTTGYNKTRRVSRELVAALSNFRHDGEFKVEWDKSRYEQASMLTKLDRHWYRKTHAHAQIRDGMQYAVNFGTCYFMQTWDPHFHGRGRGDIRLQTYGPGDVTFVQLPKSHDIQQAYGVLIREELPINLAKRIYAATNPTFAASLVPDRQSPGWLAKGLEKVQQFVSPALRVAGKTGPDAASGYPTVDIYHLYTNDAATNDGVERVRIGKDGTNWAYEVPYLGEFLPIPGQTNPNTGAPYMRPADGDDCLLFPRRRYTIFSSTGICFDGPSPWWHGQVPVARLSLGDWAWEALGSSLIADVRTLQVGIEATMRGIEDSIAARLNPPMVYDQEAISKAFAENFNPRKAGARAQMNLQAMGGTGIQFPVPPEIYNVPPFVMEYLANLDEKADYVSGVKDVVAIAKARQLPSADTLEKILEMAGPIVQDMVRALEAPFTFLGNLRKAYYLQFYNRARMITTVGLTGVPVDEEFKPMSLLRPGEVDSPEVKRASLDEFYYDISESGLNEIHRMSTKLLYLQLSKAGFPISPWTMAEILQIPNFGPPPEGTNNEMERWVAWQHMNAELQGSAQAEGQIAAAQAMGGAGMMPPGAGGPEGQEGSDNTGQTGQSGAGRPPSFQSPPRMSTKDGGTRTTVETSR